MAPSYFATLALWPSSSSDFVCSSRVQPSSSTLGPARAGAVIDSEAGLGLLIRSQTWPIQAIPAASGSWLASFFAGPALLGQPGCRLDFFCPELFCLDFFCSLFLQD